MDYTKHPAYNRSSAQAVEFDQGLRAYMLQVYNYMASALALTGIVAWLASSSEAVMTMFYAVGADGFSHPTILGWIALFAPLGVVIYLSARMHAMSFKAAQGWFWFYAGLVGLSLAPVLLAYTGASVARTFFITAGTFGAMSLYGYTTKRDLSGWGSFLFMGVIGIILASLVNLFLKSSGLELAISIIGVLIFTALIAYDTQKLKGMYNAFSGQGEMLAKSSIMGALSLYLDFINLFMMLLRFVGDRR